MVRRFVLALVCVVTVAGCHAGKSPELRVIGVHDSARHEVVFVQVTNPANRPMRLTKLEYTFAAAGQTLSEGEVPLQREVPAGAVVVLEVPLDAHSSTPMTLRGKLTTELDEIQKIFSVSAQIQPL
jgi:LEA14-like dessication related protein